MTEFTLPKLDEAEQRLDAVFAEAFGADHPALHDWVAIKFALKERAQAIEALSPFALFGTQFAGRDDILTRLLESPDKVQGLPVGAFKTAVETFCKLFPDWHPELREARQWECFECHAKFPAGTSCPNCGELARVCP